jgi:hypothetical protein
MNRAVYCFGALAFWIAALLSEGGARSVLPQEPSGEPSTDDVSTGSGRWDADLGLVEGSHRIAHDFVLFNEGSVPLAITGIGKGCTCEFLEFSSMVIPPGGGVAGKARVSSSRFASSFRSTFTLEFTGERTFEKKYTIFGGLVPHWPCFAEFVADWRGSAALRITLVSPERGSAPAVWPALSTLRRGALSLPLTPLEVSTVERPDSRTSKILVVPLAQYVFDSGLSLDPFDVEFTDPAKGNVLATATCRLPAAEAKSETPRYYLGVLKGNQAVGTLKLYLGPEEYRSTRAGVLTDCDAIPQGLMEVRASELAIVPSEGSPSLEWTYDLDLSALPPGPHRSEIQLTDGLLSRIVELGFILEDE